MGSAPEIKGSTEEERRAYIKNRFPCIADCDMCGLCKVFHGKDAETLVLKEQKESKLHTKVIADYFRNSRSKVVLNTVLNQIGRIDQDGEFNDKEYERLIDTVLPYFWEEPIDEVVNQDEGFRDFKIPTLES